MQTFVVLVCLVAVVVAQSHQEPQPADAVQESFFNTPVHDRSPRNKRGLLLLKKKLILGALGLKAAKVGAVGAAGVALALKAKAKPKAVVAHGFFHHGYSRHWGDHYTRALIPNRGGDSVGYPADNQVLSRGQLPLAHIVYTLSSREVSCTKGSGKNVGFVRINSQQVGGDCLHWGFS